MSGKGHDPWEALTRARELERAAEAQKEKDSWFSGMVAKLMISTAVAVIFVVATGLVIGRSTRSSRRISGQDRDQIHLTTADRMGPEKRRWLFITVGIIGFAGTMLWLSRPPEEDLQDLDG